MILIIAVVFFGLNALMIALFFPFGIAFMIVWCLLNLTAGFQRGYTRA